MVDIFQDPQARSWYKLFVHMDDDLSGKINYYELEDMIRNELKVSTSKLSDDQLKAIWRTLDEDQSGLISSGEFGRFMRLGAHIHVKNSGWKEARQQRITDRGATIRQELKDLQAEASDSRKSEDKATMNRTALLRKAEVGRTTAALSQVVQRNVLSARALRQERDERLSRHITKGTDGTTPRVATEQECEHVAIMLNHRMCEIILDPQARSWYKLFVHMDDDLSGKINFHELEDMVRNELKISKERLPEEALKAVWLALDEDKSGLISCGEFGHFMMRGTKVHETADPLHAKILRAKKALGVELRQEKQERLQAAQDLKTSDKAAKRSNAADKHDVLWGLRPGESKPGWRSSRALVC
jgi:Ca2+-binding EF-hand superfamily protein